VEEVVVDPKAKGKKTEVQTGNNKADIFEGKNITKYK
jgi:hypothetical protein